MAHRAKHRHVAILRRAAAGRQIKTDQSGPGKVAYDAAVRALTRHNLRGPNGPKVTFWDEAAKLVPSE